MKAMCTNEVGLIDIILENFSRMKLILYVDFMFTLLDMRGWVNQNMMMNM